MVINLFQPIEMKTDRAHGDDRVNDSFHIGVLDIKQKDYRISFGT